MPTPIASRSGAPVRLALGVLALCACFSTRTRTRTVPSVDLARSSERMIGHKVVLVTDSGPVGMRLDSLRYPYLMGHATAHGGVAQVRIDQYDRYAVVVLNDSGRITSRRALRPLDVWSDPGVLVGKSIRFTSPTGSIVLRDVTRVDSPWAEGRLVSGDGPIRADLRAGRTLDVSETNWGKSLLYTASGLAVAALVVLLVLLSDDNIFNGLAVP